jgi:hypothetical protein
MMKYIKPAILILTFIGSLNTFACTVDPTPFQSISKDIHVARALAIVKVSGDIRKRFFTTELPWQAKTLELYNGPCSLPAAPEQKYLFLSYKSFDELESLQPISNSNGRLSVLDLLDQETIDKLASKKELPIGHPNVFWSFCKKSDECIKAKNKCGINKKFISEYQSYMQSNQKDKGVCPSKKNDSKESKCIEFFCS